AATLRRWLNLPDFRAHYAEARTGVLERTVARLLAATGKAVEALERNLEADRPADEVRAARAILAHATKGVEVLDLAEQVAELRRQVQEIQHGDRPRIVG